MAVIMDTNGKNERALVFDIAATIREHFLRILESSIKTKQTKGSCLYACALLKTAYSQFTDFKVLCRGGDGITSGFRASSRELHGHYWLAVKTQTDTFIVDITADQFGYPAIIVEEEHSSLAYLSGDQENIDEHFESFLLSLKA